MTQPRIEAQRTFTADPTTAPHEPLAPTVTVVVEQHGPTQAPARRRPRGIAAVALAAGGATLVGAGAFSAWDATTSVTSGGLSAGTSSAATVVDAAGGTFSTGVSNLLPGDYFYRYLNVTNTGAAATFTGAVAVTGQLAGYLAVDAATCPTSWTIATATCAGVASPPSIGSGTPTTSTPTAVAHGAIANAAVQYVRYKFTFSDAAPNSLQGTSGAVAISVSNTVVGGTDRTLN